MLWWSEIGADGVESSKRPLRGFMRDCTESDESQLDDNQESEGEHQTKLMDFSYEYGQVFRLIDFWPEKNQEI